MQPSNPLTLGDLSWRVARTCNAGTCIRVAADGDTVFLGDSKSPEGPVLVYSRSEWTTFVEGVRGGDFDDL
ncbi:MAG TPA: DUF397 domain-containing protein, partial [Streptosporangiaceae bacterium]|nr:DUF397 domain-containing protein [Streptosporangiaceae bacterium]